MNIRKLKKYVLYGSKSETWKSNVSSEVLVVPTNRLLDWLAAKLIMVTIFDSSTNQIVQ